MNSVRVTVFRILRTYSTKRSDRVGLRHVESLNEEQFELDEIEGDDLNRYESDFVNVGQSYPEHVRELKNNKLKLKQRIVAGKYFKEVEPTFLTHVDKEEIRKLHEHDPQEWTPERLSESFPALPHTIRKILKVKWAPKTVERVVSYDAKVAENWKKFRAGKLAVSPVLMEHLMKFKHRKIILSDRESLAEKFVTPPMVFKKPTSTFFTSLLKGDNNETQLIPSKDEPNSLEDQNHTKQEALTSGNSMEERQMEMSLVNTTKKSTFKSNNTNRLTFNEFVKEKLETLYRTSPEEGIALMNVYRKQMESADLETKSSESSNNPRKEKEMNVAVAKQSKDENALITHDNESDKSKVIVETNLEHNSLDTYVKDWKKTVDMKCDYANRIKIPKNAYKPGKTYRIQDCYYDADGEFLYRTPGLRT